ncbi:hypothetical protein NZD89_09165 [Alicyclobacillus fastidiosus]|uniref:Uncharacterized protein n=1 Tax=Alicyclobacillus fastidiosus TaxID=392011 RepID=A0ABY6ZKS2_9BACL|nr:hypothetical protein [Alicyclobacillus fastidiosus]WAH43528.1 hypothetical protein NZD89_09165 [Alicyclobacillus fastidiosus]
MDEQRVREIVREELGFARTAAQFDKMISVTGAAGLELAEKIIDAASQTEAERIAIRSYLLQPSASPGTQHS